MPPSDAKPRRYFTEAAMEAARAAKAAKAAKRTEPERFGLPELFIVKAGDHAFTWELRRFGAIVLQRGPEAFPSQDAARVDGEAALAALCASPDLPRFKRQAR